MNEGRKESSKKERKKKGRTEGREDRVFRALLMYVYESGI